MFRGFEERERERERERWGKERKGAQISSVCERRELTKRIVYCAISNTQYYNRCKLLFF